MTSMNQALKVPKTDIHSSMIQCAECRITKTQLLKCSACVNTYYCSKECQKKNWKTHKPACLLLQKANTKLENPQIASLREWGRYHKPFLANLTDVSCRLTDSDSQKRVCVLKLQPQAPEKEKRYKIIKWDTYSLKEFEPVAKQYQIPMEQYKETKGIYGFCLVFCNGVMDFYPFENNNVAEPYLNQQLQIQFFIDQINEGIDYSTLK